jgi:hypothetical protein
MPVGGGKPRVIGAILGIMKMPKGKNGAETVPQESINLNMVKLLVSKLIRVTMQNLGKEVKLPAPVEGIPPRKRWEMDSNAKAR